MWQSINQFLSYPFLQIHEFSLNAWKLIFFFSILLSARLLVGLIRLVLNRRLKTLGNFDEGRRYAIISIAKYFIYTLAFLLAMDMAGLDITLLVAGSTALLVGLGFGLQNTFNDFISGIVLLFEGSLQIGDVVEINQIVGRVTHIGLRTSKIETRDRVIMIVPNSKFVSDAVINWSHQRESSRFKVSVGVAYGSDVDKVKSILLSIASQHPEVVQDPPPRVLFKEFGDSALQFELYFFTGMGFEAEFIKGDLRFEINRNFRAAKITIPFPQRDVHFHAVPIPNSISTPAS